MLIKRKIKPKKHRKQKLNIPNTCGLPIDPKEIDEIKNNIVNIAGNLLNIKEKGNNIITNQSSKPSSDKIKNIQNEDNEID